MTKTEAAISARRALVERLRRFEQQLAHDRQIRAAAHDLVTFVQVVQLASIELGRRVDEEAREFVDDLQRAAADADRALKQLMAERPSSPGSSTDVRVALDAALAALQPALAVELEGSVPIAAATLCTVDELEHVVIGLVLAAGESHVQLHVRTRTIEHVPWLELLVASPRVDERFELRVLEAIAVRAGGEVTVSERRDGLEDIVVALPIVH
jgi:hypothetical protein